jgi:hypothetical protein
MAKKKKQGSSLKKDWPLWKQRPQPKLTAYEKNVYYNLIHSITQNGCQNFKRIVNSF